MPHHHGDFAGSLLDSSSLLQKHRIYLEYTIKNIVTVSITVEGRALASRCIDVIIAI